MSRSWRVVSIVPGVLLAVGLGSAAGTIRAQSVYEDATRAYSVAFSGNDEAEDTAYLGVTLEEETDHPEGGARVTQVVEGSPADEAGIRDGDIIVEFDGRVIRGPVGLTQRIHEQSAGDSVKITVVRDGDRRKLEATLDRRASVYRTYLTPFGSAAQVLVAPQIGEKIAESLERAQGRLGELDTGELSERLAEIFENQTLHVAPRVFSCEDDDCDFFQVYGQGRPLLGVQLVETTAELRRHLGGGEDAGVLVSKVLSGLPAREADIRVGDLIVSIAGEPVKSSADIRRELRDKRGETFDVEVIREGRSMRIEVTIAEGDERPTGPRASLAPLPPIAVAPVTAVPMVAPRMPAMPALPAPPAVVAPAVPVPSAPPVRVVPGPTAV